MSDLVAYWNRRYRRGKDSGASSRGETAQAKADLVNQTVQANAYRTVVDWGVGDGQVARLFDIPVYYGLDVSVEAVRQARLRCGTRRGWTLQVIPPDGPTAYRGDLALSFDVLFHLTDDAAYRAHLDRLFGSANHVLIRASNYDEPRDAHMRRRHWSPDIPDGWQMLARPDDDHGEGFWELRR